jgi:quinol monooxygenase YgiN
MYHERNSTMPYLIIRHKVEDYDRWKPSFDDHSQTRAEFGSTGYQLLRSADDPNELVMIAEVSDLDKARELVTSDDLREAMQRAGVADQPDVYFLEEIERGPA